MIKTSLNRATSSYQPLTKDKRKASFPKTEQPVQPNREYTSPETLELQGYKQPKVGAMIENVMAAQLAGMSDRPSTKDEDFGNQLRVPRPDKLGSMSIQPKLTVGRPPTFNEGELGNQLRAPRPDKLGSMVIQPKLTVGRPPSRNVGELGNQLRAPRPFKLGSMTIQPKLTIGESNDAYEQEADRVASRVVDEINAPAPIQRQTGEEELQREPQLSAIKLQGKTGEKDLGYSPKKPIVQWKGIEEGVLLRRAAVNRMNGYRGGEATGDLESSINSARGSGQPLDQGLQEKMGQAMGADFSGVRVHTDAQSDQLNQSIQAKAFTTGQDVFFRQGAYEPSSRGGQELIAHELTHVVQQNGVAVQRKSHSEVETTGDLSSAITSIQESVSTGDRSKEDSLPPIHRKEATTLTQRRLRRLQHTSNILVGRTSVAHTIQRGKMAMGEDPPIKEGTKLLNEDTVTVNSFDEQKKKGGKRLHLVSHIEADGKFGGYTSQEMADAMLQAHLFDGKTTTSTIKLHGCNSAPFAQALANALDGNTGYLTVSVIGSNGLNVTKPNGESVVLDPAKCGGGSTEDQWNYWSKKADSLTKERWLQEVGKHLHSNPWTTY
ncbi:DUF4157 domain-containing protein [Okeania sp. SIO2C9]|uniref:eCIS core domain-containing protein n=1 Tax=Okeania sp. SIO2C9 TaxID=2607791 RepID=UPI0025F4B1DA|nr:DUF4157 domain-containing protein [Okeania sp. SIO2C9]